MNDVKKTDENKDEGDAVDEKDRNINNVKKNKKATKNESFMREQDGK